MGANVFSRPQTQRDSIRIFTQVNGSPFDSLRRSQTPITARNFPDTEEVSGSNPVRPTSKDAYQGRSFLRPSLVRHGADKLPGMSAMNEVTGSIGLLD
jgi:hypothetical protein